MPQIYGYPANFEITSISKQIKILRKLFPNLKSANEELAKQPLPLGAGGWFAVPRRDKIAPTPDEAVQKVLALIQKTRNDKFFNFCEGNFGPQYLRQSTKTAKIFQILGDKQKNHDILIFPAQLGLNHRGKSVRQARKDMNASEFGLDIFSIIIILLTNLQRLQHYNDLWINCAGDEYSFFVRGDFSSVPYFGFRDNYIELGSCSVDDVSDYLGSATAFLIA